MAAADYPPELMYTICAAVFDAARPPPMPSLDPMLSDAVFSNGTPQGQPSTYPASIWKTETSRKTLASLCLVNRAWHEAARPWLWYKVEVSLPHSWMALLEQVAGNDGEEEEEEELNAPVLIDQAIRGALPACPEDRELELVHASLQAVGLPDVSIPPELLSPAGSREPSPSRPKLRAHSPGRWRLFRTVTNAVQNVLSQAQPGLYFPLPKDTTHPGIHVRHLDFTHFRTIGMRRSVGEGMSARFVTSDRLLRLLKEMPNLVTFGATEYMDGALNLSILQEIFFRGTASSESNGRGRSSRREDPLSDTEQDDLDRRRECRPLEALDLCGCVSPVFANALNELVTNFISTEDDSDPRKLTSVPGLKRLGLRGLASIPAHILSPLVLICPNLTHLDLSATRCGPELLDALAVSPTVRLEALALGRCVCLTSISITDFLINSPAAEGIKHLSLYGDATFPSVINAEDLMRIVLEAPSFLSGEMEYLDLSSTPVSPAVLDKMAPQPTLRTLGLCHIMTLPLRAVASFLEKRAPNVEVLCLVNSTPELAGPDTNLREINMSLHCKIVQPLCMPPFRISGLSTQADRPAVAPTRLRVIELGPSVLGALSNNVVYGWRVVRSKGGRAWYVDSATGWVNGELRRNLDVSHPLRREVERLADANGNISSSVGWHSRKMEVLQGVGMMGREEGLYGAVSFAYQG